MTGEQKLGVNAWGSVGDGGDLSSLESVDYLPASCFVSECSLWLSSSVFGEGNLGANVYVSVSCLRCKQDREC